MRLFPPMNPPINHWQDQRVWIIGATRGIGAALARELASCGAQLQLSGRQCQPLDDWLDQQSPSQRQRIRISRLDIRDEMAIRRDAETLMEYWGSIDLVIVAAGIYDGQSAAHLDLDHLPLLADTLATNLMGPYRVAAALLPLLRQQGRGHLAFISSVAGYNGLPQALAYAPSKAALNNLCEGLYLELRPQRIAITRICPGFVATDMTASVGIRMPALMQPHEAARAIRKGLEHGDFEIHFPHHFTYGLKFLQWLPRRLYFRLLNWAISRG